MKRALITGISGFVGPYLRAELERNGYIVFGVDKSEIKKVGYYCADITNFSTLSKVLLDCNPTHIFHLAGVSSPRLASKNPELTENVNVNGTKNLFEAALRLKNKPKIIVAGSSYVYGTPKYLPIDENHPLNGTGVYAKSRIKQEEVIKGYSKILSINTARSFNHTGSGQSDIYVIPKIIKHIIEIKLGKRDFLEIGNVDISRDITDVRDVVCAYRMLIEQEEFGIFCNVCRGESISLKDVIKYAKVHAQLEDLEIVLNENYINKDDILDTYGTAELLKKYTGWEITIEYKQMLNDMFVYFK